MGGLVDALARRDSSEVLLSLPGRMVTVGEMLRRVVALRASHSYLHGKAVWIGDEANAASVVLALLVLDGWASALRLGCGREIGEEELVLEGLWAEEIGSDEDGEVGRMMATQWMMQTSGTTGQPNWVAHKLDFLMTSVKTDREKGKCLVWGLLYDLQHFAGIQVFVQALLGGSALAIPEESTDLEGTASQFARAGVNALSGTPSWWRRVLMGDLFDGLDLKIVTLGGEPVDAGLLEALRLRFPHGKITHIYASTELGVGFSVTDGQAGFPVSFLDDATRSGVRLRVAEGRCLEVGDAQGQWWNTGDLVERVGDRYFFNGRVDGMINVGGAKVAPEMVERIVLGVPGVAMALAHPRASSILGQVVEVFVVPPTRAADRAALEKAVIDTCRRSLERHAVPALVHVVDALPMTAAGKIDRRRPRK